jgi:hypothetical protein
MPAATPPPFFRLLTALPALAAVLTLAGPNPAQDTKTVAYPQRDLLSPFRNPTEVYAPPDRLFALLRRMRTLAESGQYPVVFDDQGRETVDAEAWRDAKSQVDELGIDAATLAVILRTSKNADDRTTAFYATFFCKQANYLIDLLCHIPGEPERRIRERALPLAIAWLQRNLGKKFGDLDAEHQKALTLALPQPGSPAAKAAGITRLPQADDLLYADSLRLYPFFQLLDLDEPIDQAQGLWFLKEMFRIRKDLALRHCEPALPRIRQLLVGDDRRVREQAIGLLAAIGPANLREAGVDEPAPALLEWAEQAARALFPPIRNLNDAVVQLHPSPERDAVLAALQQALSGDTVGEASHGRTKDGVNYRGFLLRNVPAALRVLAIPAGAVITTVNGVGVSDARSVLRVGEQQLRAQGHPRQLFVEYVLDGSARAIEYRIM